MYYWQLIRINWGSFKPKTWEENACSDIKSNNVDSVKLFSNSNVTSEIHVSFKSYEVLSFYIMYYFIHMKIYLTYLFS